MSAAVHADGKFWIAPFARASTPGWSAGPRPSARRTARPCAPSTRPRSASSPDALGLISWNEFSENTYVEPSTKFGHRYLDVLPSCGTPRLRYLPRPTIPAPSRCRRRPTRHWPTVALLLRLPVPVGRACRPRPPVAAPVPDGAGPAGIRARPVPRHRSTPCPADRVVRAERGAELRRSSWECRAGRREEPSQLPEGAGRRCVASVRRSSSTRTVAVEWADVDSAAQSARSHSAVTSRRVVCSAASSSAWSEISRSSRLMCSAGATAGRPAARKTRRRRQLTRVLPYPCGTFSRQSATVAEDTGPAASGLRRENSRFGVSTTNRNEIRYPS